MNIRENLTGLLGWTNGRCLQRTTHTEENTAGIQPSVEWDMNPRSKGGKHFAPYEVDRAGTNTVANINEETEGERRNQKEEWWGDNYETIKQQNELCGP
jgi:hypothetical protein